MSGELVELSLSEREAIKNMRADFGAGRKIMASDASIILRVLDRLLAADAAAPAVAGWQPIETAPENTDILTWSSYNTDQPFCVDRFVWIQVVHDEIESETRNAKGRRRIIQEIVERKREWQRSYGAEYWMPLPDPPKDAP